MEKILNEIFEEYGAEQKIRISTVPMKNSIAIEIPHNNKKLIKFDELVNSTEFKESNAALPIAMGMDTAGKPFINDLHCEPHILVAGRTGSGKSIFMQSILMSLMSRHSADECKFVIIDTKGVDFERFENSKHLYLPYTTVSKTGIIHLQAAVAEIDNRYAILRKFEVQNITEYNKKNPDNKMPYIIVLVDELADLMLTSEKDTEYCIQKIAQKARAAGIHMIVATQRPSSDVLSGIILANFATRISFQARNNRDSITTLGEIGAEKLLSCGDMLYSQAGRTPVRIHAGFIDDSEVENISEEESANDDLYEQAKAIVLKDKKPLISHVQKKLGIGYNRAYELIMQMETDGIISTPDAEQKRHIL